MNKEEREHVIGAVDSVAEALKNARCLYCPDAIGNLLERSARTLSVCVIGKMEYSGFHDKYRPGLDVDRQRRKNLALVLTARDELAAAISYMEGKELLYADRASLDDLKAAASELDAVVRREEAYCDSV